MEEVDIALVVDGVDCVVEETLRGVTPGFRLRTSRTIVVQGTCMIVCTAATAISRTRYQQLKKLNFKRPSMHMTYAPAMDPWRKYIVSRDPVGRKYNMDSKSENLHCADCIFGIALIVFLAVI